MMIRSCSLGKRKKVREKTKQKQKKTLFALVIVVGWNTDIYRVFQITKLFKLRNEYRITPKTSRNVKYRSSKHLFIM